MSIHRHQSIEQAHAYFTECQLATLAHMAMLKSTSKSSLRRQKSICLKMLQWVDGDSAAKIHRDCGRVLDILKDAKKGTSSQLTPVTAKTSQAQLEAALDREIERLQGIKDNASK